MENLFELIRDELQAKRDDDGCHADDLTPIQERFAALHESGDYAALEELYQELVTIQPREPRPHEPSDLEGIRAARAAGPRIYDVDLPDDVLYDKVLGGLLGRAAGCALGKPVEGWRRADIEAYLRVFGEEDLTDYVPWADSVPEGVPRVSPWQRKACRGEIRFMPRDDDMDYTVLGLHILQHSGLDFTTHDMANLWLSTLPYHCTYTAERVAYRNLILGKWPPATSTYRNPYREWIGAQIRADGFGYACPGRPELAAELAWRDASLSHVKNGIYGEMWMAAAIATAFVTDDIYEVIETATSEIPKESRFAAMVRNMLGWREEYPDWKSCWERVNQEYGHLNWVHTINNAALVVLGLLYGEKDFGRTICIAVQGGWDTDCNGASAGSILGVMLGAQALPEKWVGVLNDTLETAVFGYNYPKFSDLARVGAKLGRQVIDRTRG